MARLTLLAALLLSPTAAAGPNVIVILTDDQGWGDLSRHGNRNLKTPHLDSLARDGASFDRFFVQPVCSPTRVEFLTGRYHVRSGVRDVSRGGERLNLDEKTIADAFRAAGYRTGLFGKWHNGSQYPYHPTGRGFDEFYGFTHGHWGHYFDPPLDHNGRPVRGTGFLADDLTDRAVAFVTAARDKPAFCVLAYNTPHSPMQVPDPYWDRFRGFDLLSKASGGVEDVPHTQAALAMCENLDDNVGRLLAALDRAKLAADTVVVFFSDNGPNGWRFNGGMKGRKGSTDEGGVRSPLFVRWPGKIAPGTDVKRIAGAIDLLPTLAGLCGVKPSGDKPLDGEDVSAVLLGKAADGPDRTLFQHWNGKVSARNQTHRLDADGKLYDMTADPGQRTDVAKANGEVVKSLAAAVAGYRKLLPAKPDDRPFPVGYKEMAATFLPARDGVPHGGVKRSAAAPNCSYFTRWTTTADRMTWDIDIRTDGNYTATLHYTCPEADVGSTVEIGVSEHRVSGTIAIAHDPKPFGPTADRVPRVGESDMKAFRPLRIGAMNLPAGRGTLTLRATQVAGKQVADVWGVELTLE